MSESQILPSVFISYAHDDLSIVRRLYDDLQERQVAVWLDKSDMRLGSYWKKEIRRRIPQSQFFLFCLSTAALTRIIH